MNNADLAKLETAFGRAILCGVIAAVVIVILLLA